MKALLVAFNQEKALVGAFSMITNLRMDLYKALLGSLISVAVYDNSVPGLGHTGHLIFSCLISASNWSHQLLLLVYSYNLLH